MIEMDASNSNKSDCQYTQIIIYISKMFANNQRSLLASKVPPKTAERITKIRDLLGKAMGQVNKQINMNRSRSPQKRRSEESSEPQAIAEVLANLKKGYLMIKHSQKINQPHDKFVYLSPDSRYICWKSLDKDDQKRIEVTLIEKVVKEGAQFYIRSNKIRDLSRSLVVISAERKLQLEATSQIQAEYFRYELLRVVKYWKGMHLNYKYNKS